MKPLQKCKCLEKKGGRALIIEETFLIAFFQQCTNTK